MRHFRFFSLFRLSIFFTVLMPRGFRKTTSPSSSAVVHSYGTRNSTSGFAIPLPSGIKEKEFDREILQMNNQNFMPAEIAKILCAKYKLDPSVVTRRKVDNRLRYLASKQEKLAPVNAAGQMPVIPS